ncbi:MAG: hypothetical protein ACOY3F_07950 [Bacillota bacterium]
MRSKPMVLAAVLLCTLLCARPVAAAAGVGAAQERNVQVIETGPFGYVRWIEAPSPAEKGKRYWVVPSYEYASWERYAQFRNGYVVSRLTEPPRGIVDSYREAGGLLRMVLMAVGNRDLFIRGFRDVFNAVNESANFINRGMANLNGPQQLYEFWKEKGIYDKYTPGERAFLNQVVMPAVAVTQWVLTGLGSMGTGFLGGAGIAALGGLVALACGAALGPVLLAVGIGAALGAVGGGVLGVLLSHLKGTRVREAGGDVNSLQANIESHLVDTLVANPEPRSRYDLFAGMAEDQVEVNKLKVVWNGLFPKAGAMEVLAGGLAGSVLGGLAGYLTVEQQYNLLATYNAYGIPELVETPVPPAVWNTGQQRVSGEKNAWELIYSLSR